MRLHLGLALAHAIVSFAAAPVPKRPPAEPPALTVEMMVGEWDYAWGQWPNGGIVFNADGSYGAMHDFNSTTAYGGTWTVKDNTLTIVERSYDLETGRSAAGGTYVFDFGATRVPNLAGVSNGDVPVKLTKPKR